MMINLKAWILILLTLISIVSSFVDEFSTDDLKQLRETLDESSTYMTREVRNEDAVICVGATRSGKSTLINYLIGNQLVAERHARGHPVTIKKANPLSKGPEIGRGTTSKTNIPSRWVSTKLPHLAIWDSPGFDDNRGSVQDITNAFYLYKLLQKVKTLRVVIVVDINNILSDNIQPFVSVLSAIEELLGYENKTHLSTLTVIFTKVPDTLYDEPVDKELISSLLSEKFLSSNMSLSQASKDIVKFLINNNNRIAFFKRAKVGLVTCDVDVDIFPAIRTASQLEKDTLQEIRPRISDRSKVCLFKSRNILLPKRVFNGLETVVRFAIDKKVNDSENNFSTEEENKIRSHMVQLNQIERQLFTALNLESDFRRKIEIIQSIDTGIKNEVEGHNLLEKIQLMKFVDKILGLDESTELALSLQAVILSSESKVREAIASAQLRLGEITQRKHDELIEEQKIRHQKEIEKLDNELKEVKKRNEENEESFWNKILMYAPAAAIGAQIFLGLG